MTPSVVANELSETLLDYIRATLSFSDPSFTDAFQAHLRGPDGLFRGPYLRLGLPFQVAAPDTPIPLHIRPRFAPYAHQLQAFTQLSTAEGGTRQNTLVTTGTGSGKTECFLYPVLDHCWRTRNLPGIKAILIYPMNALATDQARRLAELIHEHPELDGLRAGLFVGGDGKRDTMGPDHLIDDKDALRAHPPSILLTNYKMLDFLLLRPNDRALWAQNGPSTLRYLVIDELHTFDGAQGSDVACLIRRLKARLETPPEHLLCAGTSATIGSSTDPDTFARLADFATTVFGEPFAPEAVVREQRVPRETFLEKPFAHEPPTDVEPLQPIPGEDPEDWLRRQAIAWLPHPAADRVELGHRLRAHPAVHALLRATRHGVTTFDALQTELFPDRSPREAALLLQSLLGLVSYALRPVGSVTMPLLTVQVQLWCRELRRLLRAVPEQHDGQLLPPRFAWYADEPRDNEGLAPQAHCRECGITGLAAVQTERDRERGTLTFTPGTVGQAWQQKSREACFVWPRPLAVEAREGELIHWLDPRSRKLSGTAPVDADGKPHGAPVVLEQTLASKKTHPRFAARCPACGADDGLSMVGARGASLTSVAVTHLYQSPFNGDKKLLAFTDSVQDACHRAGFFGGRTYRIHLRTAIQAVVSRHGTLRLSEAGRAFEEHWRQAGKEGAARYLADFLPPDLRELPEVMAYTEKDGAGSHEALWRILRERMGWEILREYGVAAAIGRSLERSAASAVQVDPERLDTAAERFGRWLEEERLHEGEADAAHFLFGLVHRLRHTGGIFHPFLRKYVGDDGNRFLLSKRHSPHMSPVGPHTKRIRFLSSSPRSQVFPCPFGDRAQRGWFADWVTRALDWHAPGSADVQRVYEHALQALIDADIVAETAGKGRNRVWGLKPEALLLTTDVAAIHTLGTTHETVLGRADAVRCDGRPAFAFRSEARLAKRPARPGFYASVYSRGTTTRVHAGEHTGLLDNQVRTALEDRFKAGTQPGDPTAPNLLVCTPTLEMGVDIGDLSAAMLCSVPPTPANYLQRVGRAGRKTGNALVFTMATARPHDMYFHAQPERMLDGMVLPPGAYLGAPAMLQRQLVAWCMDAWARDDVAAGPIPGTAGQVLSDVGRAQFPGRFLEHFAANREPLLEGFLERFGGPLHPDAIDELTAYVQSPTGLITHVQQAFDDLAATLKQYESERERARKKLKQVQSDPSGYADHEGETRDLKRFIAVINRLLADLRRTYPLNVLTDGSVLPNYAFPESGVDLQALITSRDAEDQRQVDKKTYVRPAAQALRELAPFNTFYAEGHKVEIRQVEAGPKGQRVEYWRFCPTCHHVQRRVPREQPPDEPCCPRCNEPAWVDKGQVRAMLPMVSVRSVADRVRSTITDATEERDRQTYNTHQLFEIPTQAVRGARFLPSQGFGFEYVDRVTMTEMNLGLQSALDGAAKVRIGGSVASTDGFPTCQDCGEVADPRPWAVVRRSQHAPFCPQRQGDTKERFPLYLYRQVRSEAIRFLLPFSQVGVDEKLASFRAAIDLALRRRFRGQPIHLTVASMSEPDRHDRTRRKHFLVLFDKVPGGTGYLKELRDPRVVFELLELALDGIRSCACRAQGHDGCYLCLFAHGRQRDLPLISATQAERMLARILDARHEAQVAPHGLTPVDPVSVLESELEEKVLGALEDAFSADLSAARTRGGSATFEANGTTWRLTSQVDVSSEAGTPSIADLVLTGIRGPGLDRQAVLECDGAAYHVQPDHPVARIRTDVRKRTALIQRPGWTVFALTWNDVSSDKPSGALPPELASNPLWKSLFERVRTRLTGDGTGPSALPSLSPFELLCAWLRDPGDDWSLAAAALVTATLVRSAKAGQLVDGPSFHRVVDALRHEPRIFPLPAMGLGTRTGKKDLLARVFADPHLVLALSGEGAALTAIDPTRLGVEVRLDDHAEARRSETFLDSWRTFLQLLDVLQFLPGFEATTTELLEETEAVQDDSILDLLAADEAPPYEATPAAAPDAERPSLEAVLVNCYGDEVRALITAAYHAGLPTPDLEPEELPGTGSAPVEAAWSEHQLAICLDSCVEERDLSAAKAEGWTVLLMPVDLDRLRRELAPTDA